MAISATGRRPNFFMMDFILPNAPVYALVAAWNGILYKIYSVIYNCDFVVYYIIVLFLCFIHTCMLRDEVPHNLS